MHIQQFAGFIGIYQRIKSHVLLNRITLNHYLLCINNILINKSCMLLCMFYNINSMYQLGLVFRMEIIRNSISPYRNSIWYWSNESMVIEAHASQWFFTLWCGTVYPLEFPNIVPLECRGEYLTSSVLWTCIRIPTFLPPTLNEYNAKVHKGQSWNPSENAIALHGRANGQNSCRDTTSLWKPAETCRTSNQVSKPRSIGTHSTQVKIQNQPNSVRQNHHLVSS